MHIVRDRCYYLAHENGAPCTYYADVTGHQLNLADPIFIAVKHALPRLLKWLLDRSPDIPSELWNLAMILPFLSDYSWYSRTFRGNASAGALRMIQMIGDYHGKKLDCSLLYYGGGSDRDRVATDAIPSALPQLHQLSAKSGYVEIEKTGEMVYRTTPHPDRARRRHTVRLLQLAWTVALRRKVNMQDVYEYRGRLGELTRALFARDYHFLQFVLDRMERGNLRVAQAIDFYDLAMQDPILPKNVLRSLTGFLARATRRLEDSLREWIAAAKRIPAVDLSWLDWDQARWILWMG